MNPLLRAAIAGLTFVVMSTALPSTASAQQSRRAPLIALAETAPPTKPVTNAEGNWNVEWHDYPEPGKITQAAAVLKRTWETKCANAEGGGCRYLNQLTDGKWTLDATLDFHNWGGGTPEFKPHLEIKWGYGFLGHWGGTSKLGQNGPNQLVGEWAYGEKKGKEVWRRAIPVVREVQFTTTSQATSEWTPNGPATRVEVNPGETFNVKVLGDNLWGHQLFDLGGAIDLEPRDPFANYVVGTVTRQAAGRHVFKVTGSQGGLHAMNKVIGIQKEVALGPKFSPGKKVVRVGGVSVPFELALVEPVATTPDFLSFVTLRPPVAQASQPGRPQAEPKPLGNRIEDYEEATALVQGNSYRVLASFRPVPGVKDGDLPASVTVTSEWLVWSDQTKQFEAKELSILAKLVAPWLYVSDEVPVNDVRK